VNKGPDVEQNGTSQPSGNEVEDEMEGRPTVAAEGWRRYWWLVLVGVGVLFIGWVASQVIPPRPPDPETYSCVPGQTAQSESTRRTVGEAHPLLQNDEQKVPAFFSIGGQVILTGPESQVQNAVDRLAQDPELRITLDLVRDCDISFFRSPTPLRRLLGDPDVQPAYFPFSRQEQKELVLRLYQTDVASALKVVDEVNRIEGSQHVFADLNYLTGVLGQSQCGDPPPDPKISEHEPGGSPLEASEHEPGGSPEAGCAALVADPDAFWNQYAFEHIGIGPSSAYTPTVSANLPTGKDVEVVVLDTSPFYGDHQVEVTAATADGKAVYHLEEPTNINWTNQLGETENFALYLAYPDQTQIESKAPVSGTRNISDHGLFVAGLVHAVAPDSEIELVRVLNDHGCGDLYTLNETLIQLVLERVNKPGRLSGTVFNLSLGIHKPRSIHRSYEDWMASELEMESDQLHKILQDLDRDRLESLHIALFAAYQQGAVVAAAAGNESTENQALPMHLPADYPFVIGVESSNVDRERSYFSNWGDVAAPGGGRAPMVEGMKEPSGTSEASPDTCGQAVVGLFWNLPEGAEESAKGATRPYYAYWRGTSFATPQVSGLAALVLDGSVTPCIFGKKWAAPERVFEAIRCGAPPSDGVISVPSTLSSRCLP